MQNDRGIFLFSLTCSIYGRALSELPTDTLYLCMRICMCANHIREKEIDLRSLDAIDSCRSRFLLFSFSLPLLFHLLFPFLLVRVYVHCTHTSTFDFGRCFSISSANSTTAFSRSGRVAAVIPQCLDAAPSVGDGHMQISGELRGRSGRYSDLMIYS